MDNILCESQRTNLTKSEFYFHYRFPNELFVENVVSTIKTIQNKHKLLCGISQSINSAYSVQILITIVEILFTYLSTMFFWAHRQLKDDWGVDVMRTETYMYYAVGLLLLHAGQLLALVLFCSKTAEEVRHFERVAIEIFIFYFSG